MGFGGDTLASGNYTDGSSYAVKAGTGFQFAAGADYRVAEKMTIQGSIKYHAHAATASNGPISFKGMLVGLL
jgi:opacity protein-like surface antigen